jgi:hypothetical protein
MIDLPAYAAACARTFELARDNCFTVLREAAPHAPKLHRLISRYESYPENARRFLAEFRIEPWLVSRTYVFTVRRWALSGPAWGVLQLRGVRRLRGATLVAVFDGKHWWVRGERGAVRLRSWQCVVMHAWEIE